MNDQFHTIWETYTLAWKENTEAEKMALFRECLAPNCVYRDPVAVAEGWGELVSYMLEFHESIPGGHFLTREFKSHNNRSIAEWDMCAKDGTVIGVGISYGEYNEEGRLMAMTGFFDSP